MKRNEFTTGWKYIVDIFDNEIKYSIESPEKIVKPINLFKYYSLNKLSVEGVINKYFYASHPFQFNDPYDCFKYLIDFDDNCIEYFYEFFQLNHSKSEVDALYRNNNEELISKIQSYYYNTIFSQIGIFCLIPDPIDIRMWAYFTNQKGFAIEFNLNKLETDCSKNPEKIQFHGPFPINYQSNFITKKFDADWHLSALYNTNVKSDFWKHEKEFRYLITGKSGLYIPGHDEIEKRDNRRIFYNGDCVEEIVLGFRFFDYEDILKGENRPTFKLNKFKVKEDEENDLKNKFLTDVIMNKRPLSIIRISPYDYSIIKSKINLVKLNEYEYSYDFIE